MQTVIPSTGHALQSLLRADFKAQWRNRRAVILVVLVPVLILIAWKPLVKVNQFGGFFVLSNCITVGLNAVGLMGFANSIAKDRDKGVFQRLRVAPAPSWCIMASRLLVQLAMIIIVTCAAFIIGYYIDKIVVSPLGYATALATAIAGGALYLGLGQVIVGLVKNAETVNATSRLIYIVFIMVGMFGELGFLGDKVSKVVKWSPYGVVRHIVSTGLQPANWNQDTTISLLLTLGYTAVFTLLGIKWFKWSSR